MIDIQETIRKNLYFPTVSYFSFFAKITLLRSKKRVLVVTGSSGKSSMISLITTILEENHISYMYPDHTNSAHGIPLAILHLASADKNGASRILTWLLNFIKAPIKAFYYLMHPQNGFDWYVMEADSDRPGEMKHIARLLHPKIVFWMNAGMTHSVYHEDNIRKKKFSSIIESIGFDFSYAIRSMKKGGLAIVNGDDEIISPHISKAKGEVLTVGKQSSNIQLVSYGLKDLSSHFILKLHSSRILEKLGKDSNEASSSWPQEIDLQISGYLLPEHYYYLFASAILWCIAQDIPYGIFMKAVHKYHLPPGRASVFEGIHNSHIIDSSYNNANPQSLIDALTLIATYEPSIAIIGDMRELGNESKEQHERIAKEILQLHLSTVILVGPNMTNYTFPYLLKHGYDKEKIHSYESVKELKDELIKTAFASILDQSVILVKGSQNTLFLESIVELLLKNKTQVSALCRRGKIWDERRMQIGL